MGVVKKTVFPLTWSICLISLVGRSWRQNQPAASGKGSSVGCEGLWRCQTTRKSGEAQICPRPPGSVCQEALESSSRRTNWPALNPAELATLTEEAPLTASAVRLVDEPPPLSQRAGPTM